MNFLIDQIKDQKILEMEVNVDTFIKEHNISTEAIIHTLTFDKDVYKDEAEVREYLKDKYFYNPIITDEGSLFVAVMVASNQVDIDTEVEVELRRGVIAQAANLLPVPCFDEIRFNDRGEIALSTKFGTINLTEGLPYIIEVARVAEGEHPSYGKLKITQEHLESMTNNFESKVTGVDLAVNEDHRKNEAFGWFKDLFLSFDKQTLFGQVQWNTKGIQALSEKEYRYFSPEFRFNYTHPHSGEDHGPTLLGGALTNYPFLKMEAITQLSIKQTSEEKVTDKTIELSIHNEKVIEMSNKVNDVQAKLEVSEAKTVELNTKVEELNAKLDKKDKESAHQKLFDGNKINAAQLIALNEGKTFLEVLALNEKMNDKAAGVDKDGSKEEIKLSAKEKKLADSLGLSDEEFLAGNE